MGNNYSRDIQRVGYKETLAELKKNAPSMIYWQLFDYDIVKKLKCQKSKKAYMPFVMTIDTETSKTHEDNGEENQNFIVTWQVCLYYNDWHNEPFSLATIYGRTPSEFCDFLSLLSEFCGANNILSYIHNINYDMTFLWQFLHQAFGDPVKDMYIKSQKLLYNSWNIGNNTTLHIRDSYMLYPTTLKQFCKDMKVEHGKTDGWNYKKLRTQDSYISPEELTYMENDVLGLAEALIAYFEPIRDGVQDWGYNDIPYTKTAVPRKLIKAEYLKQDKELQNWHNFLPDEQLYNIFLWAFHGGLTHGNRFYNDKLVKTKNGKHLDIKSSYPFCMCAHTMPMTPFIEDRKIKTIEEVLEKDINKIGTIGIYCFYNIRLLNPDNPLPLLQLSKVKEWTGHTTDNGRILASEQATIALTGIDLYDIDRYYIYDDCEVITCYTCQMGLDYDWFRNLVFNGFQAKEQMPKGTTKYAYQKSLVNSMYGTSVQKYLKDTWKMDYNTREFYCEKTTWKDFINSVMGKTRIVQQFQKGLFVTSWAMHDVITMSECFDTWLYTDTDSCFGLGLNETKLQEVNYERLCMLRTAGFDTVQDRDDRPTTLGIFDYEDDFTEFKVLGAKRYCQRLVSGSLEITVAGVPKSGVKSLQNDITNFKKGFIFKGEDTGKNTVIHEHKEIFIDDMGNECGDYIDLIPCDYLLDSLEHELLYMQYDTEETL